MNPSGKTQPPWYQRAALFLAALFILLGIAGMIVGDSRSADAKSTIPFIDWLIPLWIGLMFTFLGALKLYGLWKGVVGGADKPLTTRLCGT